EIGGIRRARSEARKPATVTGNGLLRPLCAGLRQKRAMKGVACRETYGKILVRAVAAHLGDMAERSPAGKLEAAMPIAAKAEFSSSPMRAAHPKAASTGAVSDVVRKPRPLARCALPSASARPILAAKAIQSAFSTAMLVGRRISASAMMPGTMTTAAWPLFRP